MPIDRTGARDRKGAGAFCAVLLAAVALAACESKQEPGKPSGQIVASVNGAEITYLQLNHLLQTTGVNAAEPDTQRDAVNALVERELLLQEAMSAKLDRDADVLQAIDSARRQILIDIYAQRMVYPAAAITESEKKTYYAEHPELFAQRRVYEMTVFQVKSADLVPAVVAALDVAHTAEAARAVLDEARVSYLERSGEQAAEQLPMGLIKQFSTAEVGDILISPQGESTNLMQITSVATKPLAFADAEPMIEQYLTSIRNQTALQERVKQLRERANVAYAAEFAPEQAGVAAAPR